MAAQPHLSCGLRGCCKSARQGLGFPASEPDAIGTPRPYLPPDIVRLIDEPLRAAERAEILRAMNEGDLGKTLRDAADAGGLLDTRFLLAAGADAGAADGDALYEACEGGHLQVAEALLDAGGTLTPEHRNVALRYAARSGRTACCELLLDRGADIGSEDHHYIRDALIAMLHVTVTMRRSPSSWTAAPMPGPSGRCGAPKKSTMMRSSRCCWHGAKAEPPSD